MGLGHCDASLESCDGIGPGQPFRADLGGGDRVFSKRNILWDRGLANSGPDSGLPLSLRFRFGAELLDVTGFKTGDRFASRIE